jgi:hypothetical protein
VVSIAGGGSGVGVLPLGQLWRMVDGGGGGGVVWCGVERLHQ